MLTEETMETYMSTDRFRKALGIPAGARIEPVFLAQGEYHRNYRFVHPVTGQMLVLRINFGSQMHLENQITYEYKTLQILSASGRTPAALYADEDGIDGHGVLVMEYIEGRPLDYGRDLKKAAVCLADIHRVAIPQECHLIHSGNTAMDILDECRKMFQTYQKSELAIPDKTEQIQDFLRRGEELAKNLLLTEYVPCCINTELNNTNFLINDRTGRAHLIDWEKPLYGDPAQDLSHFLAPTTTFWKTDTILDQEQMEKFVEDYIEASGISISSTEQKELRERVKILVPITCLRGITWCAMAWIEYHNPDRLLRNDSTFRKLERYLDDSFLRLVGDQLNHL